MRRTFALIAGLVFVAAACTPAATTPTSTSPVPQKTGDFKQSRLDLAYSFFSDNSVHLPTSKALLVSALDAMKKVAKAAGGSDDVATPAFTDKPEFSLPDFKLFALSAGSLAAKNPQVSADQFAQAGITGLMAADPDCHTYYLDGRGGVIQSRPERTTGTGAQVPPGGTPIQAQPDSAGLQAKMLDGGIAYITWHAFDINGTYKITDQVKAVLDKSVAAGAKAFLFDLRGNIGGNGDDVMAAWFLNPGDQMLKVIVRTGNAGTRSAQPLRLPAAYQLPIAIILNDRGGSAPEVFAASLKENKRATIVGQKSVGCLGGTSSVPLGGGPELYVVQQEYVGAVTGTKYNNVGILPDVAADDATAVATASKLLLDKIAGR